MTITGAKILLATLILARSSAFVFSKFIMEELTPFQALGWRFLLAFCILALLCHKHLGNALKMDSSLWKKGALLGGSLFCVMIFEMFSLRTAAVHTVAFLENLAVALVPLFLAIYYRRLPANKILIGCGFVLAGVAGLTCGPHGFVLQGGESWALLTAVFYALYIIATGAFTKNTDGLSLGILQMGMVGILSFAAAWLQGGIAVPTHALTNLSLLFQILVCSCFGFALQPVAQRYISSEEAGLYCALTPLFGAGLGMLVFQEVLTPAGLLGAFYILIGMLWVNWSKNLQQIAQSKPAFNPSSSHGQVEYLKQNAPSIPGTATR